MGNLFWYMALTFMMLNINGLHDPKKWMTVWKDIVKKDIICLQETHLMPDQEFSFQLCAQSYDFFYSHGTSNSCGVLTAVKQSLGIMAIKTVGISGRLLVLDLTLIDSTMIRVINVYASTNSHERLLFFKDLPQFFSEKNGITG